MNFLKRFGGEAIRLIMVALVLTGATATAQMWKWSTTPGTNATADPHINWAEGMPPSAVNDSARAMMAEIAKYRNDISGVLTTGGSSTAYTVTTTQGGIASPPNDGQMLAITIHTTNGASPTLAADGGTAYPIQSSSGVAVPANVLVASAPYRLSFSASSAAWRLESYYGAPFSVPVGGLVDYVGNSSPNSNFVIPTGQAISRTTYAELFALIGTTYGSGDGTTTFNLPDLRGRTVTMIDGASGRLNGVTGSGSWNSVGTTGGAATVTLSTANLPPYTPSGTVSSSFSGVVNYTGTLTQTSIGSSFNSYTPTGGFAGGNGYWSVSGSVSSSFSGSAQGGSNTPFPVLQPTMALIKLLRIS